MIELEYLVDKNNLINFYFPYFKMYRNLIRKINKPINLIMLIYINLLLLKDIDYESVLDMENKQDHSFHRTENYDRGVRVDYPFVYIKINTILELFSWLIILSLHDSS
jgi:hypothetical protein